MRSLTTAGFGALSLGLGVLLAACSSASSSTGTAAVPPAAAPIPYLLQFVGEYDGSGRGSVAQLVLHVDGTFDASLDGQATRGTYAGAATPGDPSVTLVTRDGETLGATFRSGVGSVIPAQPLVDTVRGDGTRETLVGPWIADDEGMCDATRGTWHDDDVDVATGLRCTCDHDQVYLPSRGGCVAPREGSDPPRLPVSDAARDKAGVFDGGARVSSLSLATDGRYRATIDGQAEEGTWWDAEILGQAEGSVTLACTSVQHAFGAALEGDGTVTLLLDGGDRETLQRRSQ